MPRGKKSVDKAIDSFLKDEDLNKVNILSSNNNTNQFEESDLQFNLDVLDDKMDMELVKKYKSYVLLFPELKLKPYDDKWCMSELKEKIIDIKKTINNGNGLDVDNINIDYVCKKGLKSSSGLIEVILSNFIDVTGLSNDISESKELMNILKTMMIDNNLVDFIVNIPSSSSDDTNSINRLLICLLMILFKNIIKNKLFKSVKNNNDKIENIKNKYDDI